MKNILWNRKNHIVPGEPPQSSNLNDLKKTWSACSHLVRYDLRVEYYLSSGTVVVLSGNVFCYECYYFLVSSHQFSDHINVCKTMTDLGFQRGFVDPLIETNREILKTINQGSCSDEDQKNWVCCPHVANQDQLQQIYSYCNPIFFCDGHVACVDCLKAMPLNSIFLQDLLNCKSMNDDELQKHLVDRLYPINREALETVAHFSR